MASRAATSFAVKLVVFASGERFFELVDRRTGLPLFDPTAFTLVKCRGKGLASATIEQVLRSLQVLYLFLEKSGESLEKRFSDGRLFTLGEIELLSRLCRMRLEDTPRYLARLAGEVNEAQLARAKVRSLEHVRLRAETSQPVVSADTASLRLLYIALYLEYLRDRQVALLHPASDIYRQLGASADAAIRHLRAHIPTVRHRNTVHEREGLSEEAKRRLLEVIKPESADNPWKPGHVRIRNRLIVRWEYELGIRRGEAAGIMIADIDFRRNLVLVARHADNADEPRRREPNTKTLDRLVPIEPELARLTREYIFGERRELVDARRDHKFLFVANGKGDPLSVSGFDKIFQALRQRCPDLPTDLSQQVLRHTWNDEFSELMDRSGESDENEKKFRSTLMGWNPTSGTAAIYTRRITRRQAHEASLRLQAQHLPVSRSAPGYDSDGPVKPDDVEDTSAERNGEN